VHTLREPFSDGLYAEAGAMAFQTATNICSAMPGSSISPSRH
jgi:hypothetical protein